MLSLLLSTPLHEPPSSDPDLAGSAPCAVGSGLGRHAECDLLHSDGACLWELILPRPDCRSLQSFALGGLHSSLKIFMLALRSRGLSICLCHNARDCADLSLCQRPAQAAYSHVCTITITDIPAGSCCTRHNQSVGYIISGSFMLISLWLCFCSTGEGMRVVILSLGWFVCQQQGEHISVCMLEMVSLHVRLCLLSCFLSCQCLLSTVLPAGSGTASASLALAPLVLDFKSAAPCAWCIQSMV